MRRVWIEILSLITVKKIAMSPSMRRVWIEIVVGQKFVEKGFCHPPCGGCGLKLKCRFWK